VNMDLRSYIARRMTESAHCIHRLASFVSRMGSISPVWNHSLAVGRSIDPIWSPRSRRHSSGKLVIRFDAKSTPRLRW